MKISFCFVATNRVVVDAQGNVVPGQVVIYQVQSAPGTTVSQIGTIIQ